MRAMRKTKVNELKFWNPGRKLLISQDAVKIFQKYKQKRNRNESGGILLGHIYDSYDEICEITVPSSHDSSGLYFFNRTKLCAQLKINKSWRKSSGTLIYLGEWHTHSVVNPRPSEDDRIMIKEACNNTIMEIDYLYLIIVGQNDSYWIGRQNKKNLVKLERID